MSTTPIAGSTNQSPPITQESPETPAEEQASSNTNTNTFDCYYWQEYYPRAVNSYINDQTIGYTILGSSVVGGVIGGALGAPGGEVGTAAGVLIGGGFAAGASTGAILLTVGTLYSAQQVGIFINDCPDQKTFDPYYHTSAD